MRKYLIGKGINPTPSAGTLTGIAAPPQAC
jgi:hypothetical protein